MPTKNIENVTAKAVSRLQVPRHPRPFAIYGKSTILTPLTIDGHVDIHDPRVVASTAVIMMVRAPDEHANSEETLLSTLGLVLSLSGYRYRTTQLFLRDGFFNYTVLTINGFQGFLLDRTIFQLFEKNLPLDPYVLYMALYPALLGFCTSLHTNSSSEVNHLSMSKSVPWVRR